MQDVEKHNPNKKRQVLIVFDDMIADMINNKKLEVGNLTYVLLLLHNRILKCQKKLDSILHTFL